MVLIVRLACDGRDDNLPTSVVSTGFISIMKKVGRHGAMASCMGMTAHPRGTSSANRCSLCMQASCLDQPSQHLEICDMGRVAGTQSYAKDNQRFWYEGRVICSAKYTSHGRRKPPTRWTRTRMGHLHRAPAAP